MAIDPRLKKIRAKKLGVLIRDAREKSGKNLEECAQAVGVSAEELTAMEFGERPPSLPEVEMLAYYLEVPLEQFWKSEVYKKDGSEKSMNPKELMQLRQDVIGGLIRKSRAGTGLSVNELAEQAGITPEKLAAYEEGTAAIPLPELEAISQVMNKSISDFEDQTSQVGSYFVQQKYMHEFFNLPMSIQEFIGKPVNRPYIELAIKLSQMKVEKLRSLAEGLLEITY